ncbi:hypothetical protein FOA52_008971 [Chlamydomonas sp. UWO 241]|nr:hypothetical protein FOA52_008971 [Chlamydomonas sp. UWO 241]
MSLRTHVSAGRHVVVATLKDHALFAAFNASACTLLGTGRAAIVMQAVDEESAQLHAEFAAIVDASRPEGSPPVLVHAEYKDWAAILDVYRHASAALSSRLHSGVLALAANVPAVYVAANTKYKDLMSSLGLRNLVVDPNFRRHADAGAAKFGAFLAGEVTAAVNASAEIGARLAASHSETLATYKVEVGEFLARLREADAPRFAALMCCTHGVAITRSLPREHKALVQLACMARDGIVRSALRDASYLGSTRHVRRLFSDCYGSEETAVAAAAVRVAAAAVDGVSLPVFLAMNLVRFLHDVSGRDRPAGGGVVSASFLNAKPAVGGIGVEPRRGGVLCALFTVASDAVADTVVRSRRNLRDMDPSAAVFDVLSDREEAQHRRCGPLSSPPRLRGSGRSSTVRLSSLTS